MTNSIDWEPTAVAAASCHLANDPTGWGSFIIGMDALAANPRPEGSLTFGSLDLRRPRVGRYRLLYEITEATHEILITHIGRSG